MPPVPERPTSWQTFLRAHWGAIAGADFFTTEVWTWRGLVTFYTVFVIDLASRRVQIVGSTPYPDERFMQQVVRTMTIADEGLLVQHRVLICDRDTKVERAGACPAERGRDPRGADAVSGAQCECVRRTVRAIDQRGVPSPRDPVRGTASPSDDRRELRASRAFRRGLYSRSRGFEGVECRCRFFAHALIPSSRLARPGDHVLRRSKTRRAEPRGTRGRGGWTTCTHLIRRCSRRMPSRRRR